MSYIELHDSICDHRKIRALAKRLNIPIVYAIGHMACLWIRTLRLAADGDLSGSDVEDIEFMASWEVVSGHVPCVPGQFVEVAVEVGLLDKTDNGYAIHDWEDYSSRWSARIRKRDQRAKKRDKTRLSQDMSPVSMGHEGQKGHVTGSDPNEQNRTDLINMSSGDDGRVSRCRAVDGVRVAHDVKKKLSADDIALWQWWKIVMRKADTHVIDRKRLAAMQRALANHTLVEMQKAVIGCANSLFHQGENEKNTKYNDIELICRDEKHFSDFIRLYHVGDEERFGCKFDNP